MGNPWRPESQGLYDPQFEHDACGVGFVCHIDGRKTHDIIDRGLDVLANLTHRGAAGADPSTGDGAGILIQTPDRFFRKFLAGTRIGLPEPGDYGVGMIFLPRHEELRSRCIEVMEGITAEEGQRVLGWRKVPTDPEAIGESARRILPEISQFFIGRGRETQAGNAFERKLFVIRKRVENRLRAEGIAEFYVPSLSALKICYKGLLLAPQIKQFYPDLADPALDSALALVHQRYSTNTWPTWDLAHPFRFLCHNGEINTLRGNVNWMRTREAVMSSPLFGEDLAKIFPVITPGVSDSAQLDNALELLVMGGRALPHAMMMLIPEAWDRNPLMPDAKKAFYQYHGCLVEPWDGPASIAFTDGTKVGAVLDRNGLRPSRYVVTYDNFVVMASEAGVLEIPPEKVRLKGRLQPGRMFLIDTEQGRIIEDDEIKSDYASRRPYRRWLSENLLTLRQLRPATPTYRDNPETRLVRERMFGYTLEELRLLLAPMAEKGIEAVGSMGNDTPLAALSERPQLLYSYFKQMFAQVTNPPIDSIREERVMSLVSTIGAEGNLLAETPVQARMIQLDQPILANRDLERIRQIDRPHFRATTLAATFKVNGDPETALRDALDRIRQEASEAVRSGVNILVLSDREAGPDQIPIPSLLVTAAVHHHLIREELRTRCGIVVETGEAREVAHFALLIGYGAAAINPYLAIEVIDEVAREGVFVSPEVGPARAVEHYIQAIGKGLLKIFAKMGISTLRSYRGAQIFEAVGIHPDVVEEFFPGTASRIGGVKLGVIAREAEMRHEAAFPRGQPPAKELETGGSYQWRRDGERHLLNPSSIHKLQHALRKNDYELYREYAREINEQAQNLFSIRGMLKLKTRAEPIPLDEVEPATAIVRRFCTGAMSFGSISIEAHETLAIAMNRIGAKSNSGEGGEDSSRYSEDPNGDLRRSAIKQVASGRFGVTSWYLVNANELQIKIAQGAKPGEGGQLPGHKVDRNIARVRHSTPGVGLISPPPHHDIYSIEDLAQLIHDLKNSNPRADVSVKLVAVTGVGTIAAGVAKGHAETVVIAGHDGGTGASPQGSIKHAGVPWEIGLAETQQALVRNDLRGRIRVHVDGQLRTGRDVVIGALLGAEEFGFGTIALVALGCIMMRVCHLNTCPVGVATQEPSLRKKFEGKPEHLIHYFMFVAEEVRELMAQLGFRTFEEMVGRVDRLEPDPTVRHWKLPDGLDWSAILHKPQGPEKAAVRRIREQEHGLDEALDQHLIRLAQPALQRHERVAIVLPIRNVNRTVGTMLGSEVSRRCGEKGLPDDTIRIRLTGSAGQSFGAFLPRGITMTLVGEANDYIGKGLCGGRLVVLPPPEATFDAAENILIGNVALYGATSGSAFFRGVAGERFCVRNSGAFAVVEGVGDHGCEYMTGGRTVILGETGRNFAAGMGGGIAWVWDPKERFAQLCNLGMVELERVEEEDYQRELWNLVEAHYRLTGSERAMFLLDRWDQELPHFVQVMPRDYKRALAGIGLRDSPDG